MTTDHNADRGSRCRAVLVTALRPGPIAIVQLVGDVAPVLTALTGREQWPVGTVTLASLAQIDEGLVVRLKSDLAQLMPHGGLRVLQRLIQRLEQLGVVIGTPSDIDPQALYPESRDRFEALMLEALAAAASPLAIDLLLDQPRRWRQRRSLTQEDEARSRRLDRLIAPPAVVLVGPANVGKSTLSNALLGRSLSIALDEPGTTRDYTAGRVELAGLVVRWHDTPGLRRTEDPIESRAIDLARRLLDSADLLIAMTDREHDWPELPRVPDLRVAGKCDLGSCRDADLAISPVTGAGIAELVRTVRDLLVPPEDLAHPGPWVFDERLRALTANDLRGR